jgi:hypothetical protein
VSSQHFLLLMDFLNNDFIDKELCIVKYSTIDDAIKMIHKLGKNAKLAKCDIKSAFRLLRLSPGDFDLMGFIFSNDGFLPNNFFHIYFKRPTCTGVLQFKTVFKSWN